MSDDLIRRSDAIKALCDITNNSDMQEDWHRGISVSISALYRVPSADRPQGKWLDVWQDGICSWRGTCSVCRSTNDIPPPFEANFCPSCGARMKGADDETN